MMSLRK